MVPERWELIGKAEENGLKVVYVGRIKHDYMDRMTVWKLVKRARGWYSVGQWISQGRWRSFPEKNGVKLSGSRTDRILLSYASNA